MASPAPSPTFDTTPLLHCPSRDPIPYPISYPTTWYALASTPSFYACSHCHATSILPRGLDEHFFPVTETTTGPERFCAYNTPRVRALVAQYASSSASSSRVSPTGHPAIRETALAKLEEHAARRVNVPSCHLGAPVAPDEDFEWFRLRGGIDACRACYEDFLLASTFAVDLPKRPVRQPPNQMALCDLGNAFARRMASEAGDYQEFVEAAMRRTCLPTCEGAAETPFNSRKWYQPRGSRRGLVVCEQCYLDAAGGTQYQETLFEEYRPDPRRGVKGMVCGFGACPSLAVNFGLMMEFRDTTLFSRAVDTVLTCHPCDPSGIPPGEAWFTLPGVKNFAICAPCVACLVRPIRVLNDHLISGTLTPPSGTICALNAAHPRVEQYIKKISEAAEKGQPSIFLSTASYLSTSPPCPRSTRVSSTNGYRWTGTGEFSACADCARDVISGSPLSVFMTYRDASVPGERGCDFYSERVRMFWGQAGKAPDLRGALSDFGAILRHRDAVLRKMGKAREEIENQGGEAVADPVVVKRLGELETLWREVE